MSIEELLTQIAEQKELAKSAGEEHDAEKGKLELMLGELARQCMESITPAIEAFNARHGYKLTPEEMSPGFNLEKQTLTIFASLRTTTGHEPDEEFGDADEQKYSDSLRPVVDRLLKEAGIPLTFSKLSLPPEYFVK